MTLFRSLVLFVLILASSAHAQANKPDVLTVDTFLSVDKVRPGDVFKIGVSVTLHDDWHINSNKPSEDFLIPTVVTFDGTSGLQFSAIHYPEGEQRTFAFSETPLSVYDGTAIFWADVQADALEVGKLTLSGKVRYQACNDMSCLIPTEAPFRITVPVVATGAPVNAVNFDKFEASRAGMGALQGQRSTAGNEVGALFSGKGTALALLFIFLGGLALNLTPCVYPIIPITVSFFVGQASGRLSRSFFLALIYVLGMSLTYSALGVAAAMTGGLLGASLQNPMVLIGIAGIFLLFAASMFGAFEIRVPAFLNTLAGGSHQGVFGSFFMGLTVGIVAAPCIGPFVLSLLTYVAAKGDPLTGFLLFFVLSIGLGLPFLILGTFSGSLKNLPRSGEWMIWVKKVFGVIMVAMAIYFAGTLLPHGLYIGLLSACLIGGGLWVGFIDKSTAGFAAFGSLKKLAGVLLLAYGAWTATDAWLAASAPRIAWQPYDDVLIAEATALGKPVLIDFYADWCMPCKQIDREIFGAAPVVGAAADFTSLKADLTSEDSESVQKLRQRYQVRGVPTIILIDKYGRESRRFTDELVKMAPADFADLLRELETKS